MSLDDVKRIAAKLVNCVNVRECFGCPAGTLIVTHVDHRGQTLTINLQHHPDGRFGSWPSVWSAVEFPPASADIAYVLPPLPNGKVK